MKNIKKIGYSIAVSAATIPSLVLAQFSAPSGTNLPSASITEIVTNIMNWLLMMVGILGVIGFVISGILYLTAAGDGDQIGRAKTAMLYSFVGVLVALIGVIIIKAVQGLLGGSNNF
ncbi:MAG: hypothetical protein ACD_11C00054G0022 [uncultured bacterium]|nr:MAG: hypothetical protein ACD_11C00054G0022 [uncultured bacterium]HBR72096.1 hypothetical protein [Candidatus Moranbacteria bacterium]